MAIMPIAFRERSSRNLFPFPAADTPRNFEMVPEENFAFALAQERKRSDRSGRPFLLLLLSRQVFEGRPSGVLIDKVVEALASATRETDILGWYEDSAVIGVLFTELPEDATKAVQNILGKVTGALNERLEIQELDEVSITCHVYPDKKTSTSARENVQVFFRDHAHRKPATSVRQVTKRVIDIFGSLFALAVLAPVFLLIAALIKFTSTGPVFFRQTRIGQFGNSFTFLKFRSMYVNNDHAIHKDYVTQFIHGKAAEKQAADGKQVFKITKDPRITTVGRWLRRTSLDELPQFINVLRGDMSLVGPRPPVPYEFEAYGVWHRRRVFEVKPGITGLWQVSGRSKTSFDDMVRLDLTYVRTWSLWLDIVILLRTPWAVFSGEGAY